ncbi:hypothetical protein [Camelimonas lactis]|uniref:Uncharacterized protein n=1 Tax=Camelimonas lactis TaxID=659006 RepID=A0A4R2GGY8_9HYPH|nr:hypothetical protein [Camelimonas lactis]TCO07554.1 hypothetical protein EV666_13111 [Camelimonas lactis]
MYIVDDLHQINSAFFKLLEATYFNEALTRYTRATIDLIDFVIAKHDELDENEVRFVHGHAWQVLQYLAGSTSKEVPYEVVYALEFALVDWGLEGALITTALADRQDFHFSPAVTWDRLAKIDPRIPIPDDRRPLVQIAIPKLYKQRPLKSVALYHELGHYVDASHSVSERCYFRTVPDAVKLLRESPEVARQIHHHMMEHFADAFAACYCGEAMAGTLEAIAKGHSASPTHPATKDRVECIRDFLSGAQVGQISVFNAVLTDLGLPLLRKRFADIDVAKSFDLIRPIRLEGPEELHGVFSSGWQYLQKIVENPSHHWQDLSKFERSRLVNDLVEKSIRNMQISTGWLNATTQ